MQCKGATLYTTVYPCLLCAKLIVQCGIENVIYDKNYNSELTDIMLRKGGVKFAKWEKQYSSII